MSLIFASTTLPLLMSTLSIPITATNVTTIQSILDGIVVINGGVFVDQIEGLLGQITALEAASLSSSALAQSGMIQADVVHWRVSADSGLINQYKLLMSKLYTLLGISNPNNNVTMIRSDAYSLIANSVTYSIYDDWSLIAW